MNVMNESLRRKPDPEETKRGEEYVTRIKAEMEELRELSEVADSRMWGVVKELVSRKLDSANDALNSFERLNDDSRTILLATRKTLALFMSMVDDVPRALEMLAEKLAKANAELDGLKEQLRKF